MKSKRISSVSPDFDSDQSVTLTWEDGTQNIIRLREAIDRHPAMKGLKDKDQFSSVQVGEWGWSIVWPDDLDIGSDRLLEMANEQQDNFKQTFHNWRKHHGFTYDKAAIELGISRRSIGLYENGQQPVPKYIALACKGWEAEHAASIDHRS